ncbi:MAG TPA: ATP-binding protein, partial [Burkholderiales bacterium]
GKIHLQMASVDLASVMERAIEVSRSTIDSHKHRLHIVLPPAPVYLHGDPVRLSQVFSNLLNNAAKYTPEEGQIEVTAELAMHQVIVRVKDNGCGIPADTLPVIFDLFIQANRSLARSEGGLGIGLTLVRNLVEKHGGTVEAYSNGPGTGSEFVVILPVTEDGPSTGERRQVTPRAAEPSALRILLIDDNSDANEALATLLGLAGQSVRTALDGVTALQIAAEFKPQLVLCDLGLPGMDGFEVHRRLKEQLRDCMPAIYALTGYGRAEDYELTREAGFDGHLVKPIEPSVLQDIIASRRVAAAKS